MKAFPRSVRWAVVFLGAAASSSLSGCGSGDGLPREAVHGTVEFDGKPLAKGDIQFFPSVPAPNAIAGGGPINNGSYNIAKADGLVPGSYKVMISSAGEPPGKGRAGVEQVGDMPGLGPLNAQELIPEKFNTKSTLTAEVKAGATNVFDFKLDKK